MARKDNNYFEIMVLLADYSCKASKYLVDIMTDYHLDSLPMEIDKMHKIEHQCDLEMHAMIEKLSREFITPIEREDIMSLANKIDDVTDAIEDVLMRLYMFNITVIRKDALSMAYLIEKCCCQLRNAMMEFHNFKKSRTLHEHIVEVNRLEEEGDRLYVNATRRLYISDMDPKSVTAWTHVFHILEKACDACEDVADLIEGVILKNS